MQRSQVHQGPRQQPTETQAHPTAALESPQAESIAQRQAMATASPQATRLASLTAMVNASPAQAAPAVVQQAQGQLKPTMQMKAGTPVNDDAGLEHEADVMGARTEASHAQPAQTAPIIQRAPAGTYAAAIPGADGIHWDTQATVAHASTADNRTVTAPGRTIAVMRNPPDGGAPSVEPQGWAWLRAKYLRLKGQWVRFHMINAKLGGPGNAALNLLPTTHAMNHDGGWRTLEENAKTSSSQQWTYFEVTPAYDASYPAGIPRSVTAEWGEWVEGTGWVLRGSMPQLAQGNPVQHNDEYGDASTLSEGTLKNLIRSYMPRRKAKGRKQKRRNTLKDLTPPLVGIAKPPTVTAAYKVADGLQLLNDTYRNQAELDNEWHRFFGRLHSQAAEGVWYKIQSKVYLNDEAAGPPFPLVFRKK